MPRSAPRAPSSSPGMGRRSDQAQLLLFPRPVRSGTLALRCGAGGRTPRRGGSRDGRHTVKGGRRSSAAPSAASSRPISCCGAAGTCRSSSARPGRLHSRGAGHRHACGARRDPVWRPGRLPADAIGIRVDGRSAFGRDGRELARHAQRPVPHRLVAGLRSPARGLPAGALPRRPGSRGGGRRGGERPVLRFREGEPVEADLVVGRRRRPLDGAGAVRAGSDAALRGLRRLARDRGRGRRCRRGSARRPSSASPSSSRGTASSSATRRRRGRLRGSGPPALQLPLVLPGGRGRGARRPLHRRRGAPARRRHPAGPDPPLPPRRDPARRAGAAAAGLPRTLREGAALPAPDRVRPGIGAHRLRPGRPARRRRLCRPAASRRRRAQGGAGRARARGVRSTARRFGRRPPSPATSGSASGRDGTPSARRGTSAPSSSAAWKRPGATLPSA